MPRFLTRITTSVVVYKLVEAEDIASANESRAEVIDTSDEDWDGPYTIDVYPVEDQTQRVVDAINQVESLDLL
jgi:hypothetical protein